MKILCISASNNSNMGDNSTSTQVCRLIRKIVATNSPDDVVEILPLMNHKIQFCFLCGDCSEQGTCPYDQSFNYIYSKLKSADACFWIVPHYSPLPAKLLTLFEKVNEVLYSDWIKIPQFLSPFDGKYSAVIGHGDMMESNETLKYYHDTVIKPVANTLSSFGFTIVGLDNKFTLGVPFGLRDETCIQPNESSFFPEIIHHWNMIEKRIAPLVEKVISVYTKPLQI